MLFEHATTVMHRMEEEGLDPSIQSVRERGADGPRAYWVTFLCPTGIDIHLLAKINAIAEETSTAIQILGAHHAINHAVEVRLL